MPDLLERLASMLYYKLNKILRTTFSRRAIFLIELQGKSVAAEPRKQSLKQWFPHGYCESDSAHAENWSDTVDWKQARV